MKTAIYGRVSTSEQNIESQLVTVRDYCRKNTLEVIGEYTDVGFSGAKYSRPQLDLMLKDMRENKFEAVVVFKLDRLGRSLKHLLDLLSEFKNKKVRLITVADNLDTANDSPMARFFWQLVGMFGEFEREIIRERVLSGLQRAKSEGKKLGRQPGSKDKQKRSVSGYYLRYAGKSKEERSLGPRNTGDLNGVNAER